MGKQLRVLGLVLLAAGVIALSVHALRPAPAPAPDVAATTTTVADPVAPSALFIGDGFLAGVRASSPGRGSGCLTAAAMGWTCNIDAQTGTGFVNNGHRIDRSYGRLIERLRRTRTTLLADIIIVDAGRHDAGFASPRVENAIRQYVGELRAAWPRAEIVIIEPYTLDSAESPLSEAALQVLRDEGERIGAHLVDPLRDDGWIAPAETSSLVSADKYHPGPRGHRYIARQLVRELHDLRLADVRVTDRRGAAAPPPT